MRWGLALVPIALASLSGGCSRVGDLRTDISARPTDPGNAEAALIAALREAYQCAGLSYITTPPNWAPAFAGVVL